VKRETAWSVVGFGALAGVLLAWLSVSRPTPPGDAVDAPGENPAHITPAVPATAAPATDSPNTNTPLDALPTHRQPGEQTGPTGTRDPDPITTPRPSATPGTTNAASEATRVAPERALREVQALVDKGTIGAARALAERYLRDLPDGPEARQIMSLTGVHPHP